MKKFSKNLLYDRVLNNSLHKILILILVFSKINAQNIELCGEFPPHQASSQNPDSFYYDRFGNTYDKYPLTQPIYSLSSMAGYFTLQFSNEYSSSEINLIERVFSDISSLIERRTSYTGPFCIELIEKEPIVIELVKHNGQLQKAPLGIATSYYDPLKSECTDFGYFTVGEVYSLINGGKSHNYKVHGKISVLNNSFIYVNYEGNSPSIQSNQFDLRSIIFHEALHLLGWTSLINSPTNQGINSFSQYDNLLYLFNQNSNPILKILTDQNELNCGSKNCFHINSQVATLDDYLTNPCTQLQVNNIGIGLPLLAYVNGKPGYNLTPAPPYGNFLSHLRTSCNGSNLKNFVMQSDLPPGTLRRDITPEEITVLCKIGYKINSPQPECINSCPIVFYNEDYWYPQSYSCCLGPKYTCLGNTITIPIKNLICNDIGMDKEIISIFPDNNSISVVRISSPEDAIEITSNVQQDARIYYTISVCSDPCKYVNAYLNIGFSPCPDIQCQVPSNCNNLVCNSDFEAFDKQHTGTPVYSFGTNYWIFSNSRQNTPDICQEANGNNYLSMGRNNEEIEGIAFKLKETVDKNCKLKITFKASYESNVSKLRILGSEYPPCSSNDKGINPGCVATNCNNNLFNPICLNQADILITNEGINCTVFNGIEYSIIYELPLNSNQKINYVIFYPDIINAFTRINLDDIVITKECSCENIETETTQIDCYTMQFEATGCEGKTNIHWNFGDPNSNNNTSTNNPAIHTFSDNGTYTVALTSTDECGNVIAKTLTVIVDCIPPTPCKCPSNSLVVGVNQASVTEWDDIFHDPILGLGTVCVNGTLELNQSLTAYLTTFIMGPGARIKVLPNNYFIASVCTFTPCSDKMYKGIEVYPSGDMTAIGCTFNDAHIGIDFFELALTSGGIGQNTFERNYIGVNAAGPVSGLLIIGTNKFFCNGNYLNSYNGQPNKLGVPNKTYAGISLSGSPGWNINGVNEFKGIQAGVRSNFSKFTMTDNLAEDLITLDEYNDGSILIATGLSDVTFKNNTVKNSGWGVAIDNSNFEADMNIMENVQKGFRFRNMDNRKLKVKNSQKIDFTHMGIHVSHSKSILDMQIISNKLNSVAVAVAGIIIEGLGPGNSGNAVISNHNQEFTITDQCLGIIVENYDEVDITNNIINMASSTAQGILLLSSNRSYLRSNVINGSDNDSYGIDVVTSKNVKYCCNTSNNNTYGFNFFDDCEMSQLRHNNMNSNNTGLRCDNATWIGEQLIGYSNRWPGAASYREADHLGSFVDMIRSRFDATPPPSDFFPVPTPSSDWFRPIPGTNKSCALAVTACPPVVTSNPDTRFRFYGDNDVLIDNNDIIVANPTSDWGDYQEGQSWNARISLLKKVDLFPELLTQSAIVDNFVSSNANSDLRNYLNLRNGIESISQINSTQQSSIEQLHSEIDQLMSDILTLDLSLSSPNADTPAILIQRDLTGTQLYSKTIDYFNLDNTINGERTTLIISLLSQANNISASNLVQTQERTVSIHLLNYYSLGNDYINPQIQTELEVVANQCLHEQSYAIGLARIIMKSYNNSSYNDQLLCAIQPIISSSKNNSKLETIELFPNPTHKYITISCKSESCKISSVEILSLTGQSIQSIRLKDCNKHCQVSIEEIARGCYFLKTFLDNGEVIIKKVCIQ